MMQARKRHNSERSPGHPPALNPSHPNHSRPEPAHTKGQLATVWRCVRKVRRGPTAKAAPRAANPDAMCTTMPDHQAKHTRKRWVLTHTCTHVARAHTQAHTTRKVDDARLADEPLWVPHHVGQGTVDDQGKHDEVHRHASKGHTLREGTCPPQHKHCQHTARTQRQAAGAGGCRWSGHSSGAHYLRTGPTTHVGTEIQGRT
jgi:hypothetical protein